MKYSSENGYRIFQVQVFIALEIFICPLGLLYRQWQRKREIIALCWGCGCHRWFPITRITQHHTSLVLFLSLSLALCVSLVPTLFGLLDKTTASRSAVCHTQFVNRPMESINHLIRIDSAAAAAVAPVRNSLHRRDTLMLGLSVLRVGNSCMGPYKKNQVEIVR